MESRFLAQTQSPVRNLAKFATIVSVVVAMCCSPAVRTEWCRFHSGHRDRFYRRCHTGRLDPRRQSEHRCGIGYQDQWGWVLSSAGLVRGNLRRVHHGTGHADQSKKRSSCWSPRMLRSTPP